MASAKWKEYWLIWVLLIAAAIFATLALIREKPSSSVKLSRYVDETIRPGEQVSAQGIKPDHGFEQAVQDLKKSSRQAEAVVAPPKEVSSKDAFAIQVYSFKEKARAETALAKLKEKGYKAYIMMSDLGSRGVWYRVRVGTFVNEGEAQQNLESVNKDFKSGIMVSE